MKKLYEDYDPTDDIINKGDSVSMDYRTFLNFTDGLGLRFNMIDAEIAYSSNDLELEFSDPLLVNPQDGILDIIINAHSFMRIKSKSIREVMGVSLKNNVLSADFATKEGNILTVWWYV